MDEDVFSFTSNRKSHKMIIEPNNRNIKEGRSNKMKQKKKVTTAPAVKETKKTEVRVKTTTTRFIDVELLRKIAKGDPKVSQFLHTLDELHHKYRGKQHDKEAMSIRRKLRRKGVYLSHLGHHGGLHD